MPSLRTEHGVPNPSNRDRGAIGPGVVRRLVQKPLRLTAMIGALAFGLSACDSGATTQIGSNGRSIEVNGGSSHSVSSTPDGHVITVDGLVIAITAEAITIGDADPRPLADWQDLEVVVDDGDVSITVDGETLE